MARLVPCAPAFILQFRDVAQKLGIYLIAAAAVELVAGLLAMILVFDKEKREEGYVLRPLHHY